MKHLISFLLGAITMLCIGAGVANSDILTVKPAVPKVTIVKSFRMEYGSDKVSEYIKQKVKEGYMIKTVEGANIGESKSTWIVVMEKY